MVNTRGGNCRCTSMDDARMHSAAQASVANPSWVAPTGGRSADRLGYDGAGRAITKRYLAGGIADTTYAYNEPTAVVGFTTAFDRAGNKFYERALHAENRSHLYEPFDSNGLPTGGYDSLGRLLQYERGTLSASGGNGGNGGGSIATAGAITLPNTVSQRSYLLDGLGNWRSTVFTPATTGTPAPQTEVRQHNGLNQITRRQNGSTQINPTYDPSGNLTNDGTLTYLWDALNRLVQVNFVSGGGLVAQYYYDALNRRIRKYNAAGGGSTTDCIYSGWRCVEERNPFGGGGSTDTPTMQYLWGIYLDEIIQQKVIVAVNDFPANQILYPLQDLLYRTTALADTSFTPVIREAYDTDAYGSTLIFRNAGSPPAAITFNDTGTLDTQVTSPTCPFIFTGQRFDAETGLYYYKRRYYSPAFGRFLSRDPIWLPTMVRNLYVYVAGNPIALVDPRGLQPSVGGFPPSPGDDGPLLPGGGGPPSDSDGGSLSKSGAGSMCLPNTPAPAPLSPHDQACYDTAAEQAAEALGTYGFLLYGCTFAPPPGDATCWAAASLYYLMQSKHINAQLGRCLQGL